MKDMQKMMKQAQKMAEEMQKAQEQLADIEVEGSAGGGAVRVQASGDQRILGVTIDPEIFDGPPDADDIEMLGDTVTAAVNDALDKAKDAQQEAMGPIAGGMGGLGLPGM
ncbi:MAG: nucleoid-associated protein EbfC [Actinomycetota bacterium]|jgi:DNA-binding YbaB/EbfC family protein|nr:nucleoid-associated protein EbfC [Actinomycetota bacterium]